MFYEAIPQEVELLAKSAFDCALKVHRTLGAGLLESVYETCLAHELAKLNIKAERQVILPIVYDGISLDAGLRLDLWIERKLVVEVKAVENLLPVYKAQLMTYKQPSWIAY